MKKSSTILAAIFNSVFTVAIGKLYSFWFSFRAVIDCFGNGTEQKGFGNYVDSPTKKNNVFWEGIYTRFDILAWRLDLAFGRCRWISH